MMTRKFPRWNDFTLYIHSRYRGLTWSQCDNVAESVASPAPDGTVELSCSVGFLDAVVALVRVMGPLSSTEDHVAYVRELSVLVDRERGTQDELPGM